MDIRKAGNWMKRLIKQGLALIVTSGDMAGWAVPQPPFRLGQEVTINGLEMKVSEANAVREGNEGFFWEITFIASEA